MDINKITFTLSTYNIDNLQQAKGTLPTLVDHGQTITSNLGTDEHFNTHTSNVRATMVEGCSTVRLMLGDGREGSTLTTWK